MFAPKFDIVLVGSHPSTIERQRIYYFKGEPRNWRARRLCRKHNGGHPQALVTGIPELVAIDVGYFAFMLAEARKRISAVAKTK